MKRVPVLATIVVLAAIAVMVALGFWQIRRAHEKEALLARYQASRGLPPVTTPAASAEPPLFRRATAGCTPTGKQLSVAGQNLQGQSGYAFWFDCREGYRADIGWSARPLTVQWAGGVVSGTVAPDRQRRFRLVSATGLAGLEASAPPDVSQIPNNHRSYAFQWFAFALSALIIYGLALHGRGKEQR